MDQAPGFLPSTRTFAGLVASVLLASAVSTSEAAEALRIGGTGSSLGGLQKLANGFEKEYPDMEIDVLPSLGSGGGIKALIADKIGLAVSARPLKPEEAAAGLVERQYAATPLVFATRPDTAAEGVTLEQIASVYSGETTEWPDGTRLRIVMRPAAESDTGFLRTISPEMDEAIEIAIGRRDHFVAINDQDNATALEEITGSLGLIALGQLRSEGRRLKSLSIDGNPGTIDRLRSGEYPYAKRLYVITTPNPEPAAERFLEFMTSAEGSRILLEAGYLPTEAAATPKT